MHYIVGLCQGRHEIPDVGTYIFPTEVNPLDVEGLRATAWKTIPGDTDKLTVYVTGLSVAMLAVVGVCFTKQISLIAMHYDRESGHYYPQVILAYEPCGFCGKPMSVHDWACPHCGAT